MKIHGAIIKEQNVTFAIVIVKQHLAQNSLQAKTAMQNFSRLFPRMPVVLMAQDHRGTPTYYGRRDIVRFISKVPVNAIPWKQYIFS